MAQAAPAKTATNFDKFFEKYGLYFIFSIIIVAIFLITYKIAGVFPFSKASISNYDYSAQLSPFLIHVFDFLSGDSSLFFSRNAMGGADLFQSLCFMMVSPFTLIALFFGRNNTHIAFNVILPLKVITIGCVAIFYMKKRFKKLNPIAMFLIALVYSVCGYLVSSNTYIIWLDLLIYFPLAMLGFKRLVDTGSVKLHVIFSALMIYCSFSIASFSYFIIYPLYVLYVLMVVEKDKRKTVLTNVIISLVYTVLAALPILIPNLITSSSSTRSTSLFANLDNELSSNVRHAYTKLTYILSDSIPLILGIVYLIRDRKNPLAKFLMVAGLIILIPVVVDESCYLLNMGSYNSYALRFGFLNAFFSLFTCCLFFQNREFTSILPQDKEKEVENIAKETKPSTDGKELSAKEALTEMSFVSKITQHLSLKRAIICIVSLLAFSVLVGFFTGELITIFKNADNIAGSGDFYKNGDWAFHGSFARSEGGFNVIAWIMLIALVLCIVGLLLVKYRLITTKVFCCLLAVFAIGQVTFYVGSISGGNINSHNGSDDAFKEFATALKNSNFSTDESGNPYCDFDYYRVKDYGWDDNGYWSTHAGDNAALINNTKAMTVFSSNMSSESFVTSDYFCYTDVVNDPGKSSGDAHKKSLLGDSFLGYKYVFMANDQKSSAGSYIGAKKPLSVPKKYLNFGTNNLYSDYYGIYENVCALPICFYTTSSTPLEMKGVDYFEDMQNLYSFLGGEGDLFETIVLGSNRFTITETTIAVTPMKKAEGEYFLHFDFDCPLYETYGGNNYQIRYKRYGKLGFTTSSAVETNWQTVTIKREGILKDLTNTEIMQKITLKVVKTDKLKQLATSARERIIRFTETKDGVSFNLNTNTITTQPDEKVYVYLSNNYISGSKLKINGNTVNPISNPTGLTVFELQNGANSVKTSHFSIYPVISLVVALISALLIIGLTMLRRRTTLLQNAITQKVLFIAGIALAIIIFTVFFIVPIIIGFNKFYLNAGLFKFITAL